MTDKQPNYKALCLITACLEAARIKYRMELGQAHNFVVQTLDGNEMKVRVAAEDAASIPEVFDISAQVLNHGDADDINTLFWGLTAQAGYKARAPIDRGVTPATAPGRKSTRPYGDDHDRVIMRETLFRKVPNPTQEVYDNLNGVIMTCVRFFYGANKELCLRLGYEIHDMKTYAQVWTANFWSTSRVLIPKDKDENQKLLYRFLRQRFAEFYKQMITFRTRNVFTMPVDEEMSATVTPDDGSFDDDEKLQLDQYQQKHTKLDVSTYSKRRQSAAKMLKDNLGSMDHDRLVETLSEAAESWVHCPDTRKEAKRQLELHQRTCLTCAYKARVSEPLVPDHALGEGLPVPLDEGEDLGVVDPGSSEEGSQDPLAA